MAEITLKGNPIHTNGELPKVGAKAPAFKLVKDDLSDAGLEAWSGKRKVLNVFPSIDTPVCASSVRRFNQEASNIDNTVVLNISADLPFAMKRFCAAEGIENCESLSSFRSSFGKDYGLEIVDGPLSGLASRAVLVLDAEDTVIYTEQVPEIGQEPDYDKVLTALK